MASNSPVSRELESELRLLSERERGRLMSEISGTTKLRRLVTVVILEKGNCRLQHCRFVHLPTVGRHHRAELVDEKVELVAALLLAEVTRLSLRVVLVIVVIHLKITVVSHLSRKRNSLWRKRTQKSSSSVEQLVELLLMIQSFCSSLFSPRRYR
jgi:hypothetical protein